MKTKLLTCLILTSTLLLTSIAQKADAQDRISPRRVGSWYIQPAYENGAYAGVFATRNYGDSKALRFGVGDRGLYLDFRGAGMSAYRNRFKTWSWYDGEHKRLVSKSRPFTDSAGVRWARIKENVRFGAPALEKIYDARTFHISSNFQQWQFDLSGSAAAIHEMMEIHEHATGQY